MQNQRPLLRIVQWQYSVPWMAACTACDRQFTLRAFPIGDVDSARDELESQFMRHRCAGPVSVIAGKYSRDGHRRDANHPR